MSRPDTYPVHVEKRTTSMVDHPVARDWRRFVALGDSFTEGLMDEMGPDGRHVGWADRVALSLADRAVADGADSFDYANLAVRWSEEHPTIGVDPDVCLVEPAPPEPKLQSLLTWAPGHHAPRVAIEVVSRKTAKKDYTEGPQKYAASGTRELWVFDPERRGRGWTGGPWTLQVWRRSPEGSFRQVFKGNAPAYSEELGVWLVVTDGGTRLRIADDAAGERLWLTGEESERARAESERARAESERARAESERERADALAAELAALRAR